MKVLPPCPQGKGLMTTFWVLGKNEEEVAEGKENLNPFQRQKQKSSLPVIQYPLPVDTAPSNHLSGLPPVLSPPGDQLPVPTPAVMRRKTSPFDWPQADRRLSHITATDGNGNHSSVGSVPPVDLLVSENARPYNLAERRSSMAGTVPRPYPGVNGAPPLLASRNDSIVSEYCVGRMRDSLAQRNSSIISDYNMARLRESLVLSPIHEGIRPQLAALASLAEESARHSRALADELTRLATHSASSHPESNSSRDSNAPPRDSSSMPPASSPPQPPLGCPLWDTPVDPPQLAGGPGAQDTAAAAGQSCTVM